MLLKARFGVPVRQILTPRLQQTSFSSSREASTHPGNVDAKKQRNWFQAAVKALWSDAWLILTIVFLGAFLGYLYTVRFCAPLYRVQASIEIQNNKSGAHIEALAHVLQSQSLVNGVLSSMSGRQSSKSGRAFQRTTVFSLRSRRNPARAPGSDCHPISWHHRHCLYYS